jgi:predicted ATPase
MHIVEALSIDGLWGRCQLQLSLNSDTTFLIGRNGSGKTTVVSILAAILTADASAVRSLPFASARVRLKNSEDGRHLEIAVDKEHDETRGGAAVQYVITEPGRPAEEYGLGRPTALRNALLSHRPESSAERLRERLSEIISLSWLPVERARMTRAARERSFDSNVDLKLDEISTTFTRFFSELGSRTFEELLSFFKAVFLSLLEQPSLSVFTEDIDVDAERNSLAGLFATLWLAETEYAPALEHHVNLLRDAVRKTQRADQLSKEEIGVMFDMARLRRLRERWEEMTLRRGYIEKPRTDFLQILTSFFGDKSVYVDSKNVLAVRLKDGEDLDLRLLSSGEKQMLILLGEVLLQNGATTVYVADEPELSLHVEWQEQLVASLRVLNPNAQLILATHSPDIIGALPDKTVNLETLLQ